MLLKKSTLKKLTDLNRSYLDAKGREVPNPKPMVLHPGIPRPATLQEQIQRVMRGELSNQAQQQGMDTFEEANDFNVKDDFDEELLDTHYTKMIDEIPIDFEGERNKPAVEPVKPVEEPVKEEKKPTVKTEKS